MEAILILILAALVIFGLMVLVEPYARNERREMHNNPEKHNRWCRENGVPQKAELPDYQEE
jgi:hypothetical protein